MTTDRRSDGDRPSYSLPRPWYVLPTLSQSLGPFVFVCVIGSNLLHSTKRHEHLGWWWWIGLALGAAGFVIILLTVGWHLRRLWRVRQGTRAR